MEHCRVEQSAERVIVDGNILDVLHETFHCDLFLLRLG